MKNILIINALACIALMLLSLFALSISSITVHQFIALILYCTVMGCISLYESSKI